MILVIILYAIFSGMTFINSALMESNPYPSIVGMFRAVCSGALILAFFALFYRKQLRTFYLTTQQWWWLFLYGLLIHAVGMFGFSWAVLYGNPVTLCFIFATAPFLTALIQYTEGKETLTKQKMLGLLVGLIGLLPILLQDVSLGSHCAAQNSCSWMMGSGVAIASMVLFCYGWVVFKRLLHTSTVSVFLLNGVAMLIGGLLSSVSFVAYYGSSVSQISLSSDFWYLILLFLAANIITYSLYAYLLTIFSPTFISFAGFLEPAFGMVYGALITQYAISWHHAISFLVLFLGLYLFYLDELQ